MCRRSRHTSCHPVMSRQTASPVDTVRAVADDCGAVDAVATVAAVSRPAPARTEHTTARPRWAGCLYCSCAGTADVRARVIVLASAPGRAPWRARPGDALQPAHRVLGRPVDVHLEVQVTAGRAARRPDVADHLAAGDAATRAGVPAEVVVRRRDSVAPDRSVVDDDLVAVATVPARPDHAAGCGGLHRRATP